MTTWPPKTEASTRVIPASPFLLADLGAHVGRRHEGFVLHRDGEPVDYNAFAHHWRRATTAAVVTGLRCHALRHAFASMLIAGRCSVKAVQRALGTRRRRRRSTSTRTCGRATTTGSGRRAGLQPWR